MARVDAPLAAQRTPRADTFGETMRERLERYAHVGLGAGTGDVSAAGVVAAAGTEAARTLARLQAVALLDAAAKTPTRVASKDASVDAEMPLALQAATQRDLWRTKHRELSFRLHSCSYACVLLCGARM